MGWDGLLLLNILHNNQLKELGDTSNVGTNVRTIDSK